MEGKEGIRIREELVLDFICLWIQLLDELNLVRTRGVSWSGIGVYKQR